MRNFAKKNCEMRPKILAFFRETSHSLETLSTRHVLLKKSERHEFLLSKMWNQNRCPLYNTIFCKHRYDFETQILPNNKQ